MRTPDEQNAIYKHNEDVEFGLLGALRPKGPTTPYSVHVKEATPGLFAVTVVLHATEKCYVCAAVHLEALTYLNELKNGNVYDLVVLKD